MIDNDEYEFLINYYRIIEVISDDGNFGMN